MRRNSKTLPDPPSTVIDRSFENRWKRRQVEHQAQVMIDADQREHALVKFFRNLPEDRQRDVLAIARVYHEQHGIEELN
jgi:hypothetical protein